MWTTRSSLWGYPNSGYRETTPSDVRPAFASWSHSVIPLSLNVFALWKSFRLVCAVCFDVFDEDRSGGISREELTKVLVHHRRRSRAQGEAMGATQQWARQTREEDRLRALTSSPPVMSLDGVDDKDAETMQAPPVGVEKFARRFVQV